MSKYSVKVNGKRSDIVFRHKQLIVDEQPGFQYQLYIGDEWWGSVYDMGDSWTALANSPGDMNMVQGFKRRLDAAFYIINYMRAEIR